MQPQPEAREISSAYQAEQPTASVARKVLLEEYLIYVAKERSMKIWSAQEEVSCSSALRIVLVVVSEGGRLSKAALL